MKRHSQNLGHYHKCSPSHFTLSSAPLDTGKCFEFSKFLICQNGDEKSYFCCLSYKTRLIKLYLMTYTYTTFNITEFQLQCFPKKNFICKKWMLFCNFQANSAIFRNRYNYLDFLTIVSLRHIIVRRCKQNTEFF